MKREFIKKESMVCYRCSSKSLPHYVQTIKIQSLSLLLTTKLLLVPEKDKVTMADV
jgi:hypothetical protein